jgi:flagellar biosynthesis protein FlhF
MQVRVFESEDMASGLKKIKEELGPDALILSTRTVRSGKLGLLGKPMLEITAAIDADFPQGQKNDGRFAGQTGQTTQPAPKKSSGFHHTVGDDVEHYLKDQSPVHPEKKPTEAQKRPAQAEAHDQSLHSEVNELKDLVKDLAGQISLLAENTSTNRPKKLSNLPVKESDFTSRHRGNPIFGDHLLTMLNERGINVEIARTITTFLRQNLTEQELIDPEQVHETIVATVQNLIEVQPPVFAAGQTQQRIALVGPTGVGKTTTLAKIAASYLSKYSSSLALITIDTYRIAAVEQLKVYGEIMHLPVDVVITPEQLRQALLKHRDKELILIDTAGRSPRDSYCIDELAQFLSPELAIDKHLVLSAGTRENELLDTIERFKKLQISNTIFTKTDECANLGILLNVQLQNSIPLSYVTNGQRVPEDLLEISPKIIAELIMSQHEGSMHD